MRQLRVPFLSYITPLQETKWQIATSDWKSTLLACKSSFCICPALHKNLQKRPAVDVLRKIGCFCHKIAEKVGKFAWIVLTIWVTFGIIFEQMRFAPHIERWSSGLRHTLGKRARLTASAGSNPVLSANRWLGISHKTKDTTSSYPFLFVPWANCHLKAKQLGQFEMT